MDKPSTIAKGEVFMTLLQRHRMSKGLTQTALAKKLDLVPSTVSCWESGSSIPSAGIIPKIARILDLDPMELTRVIHPPLAAITSSN